MPASCGRGADVKTAIVAVVGAIVGPMIALMGLKALPFAAILLVVGLVALVDMLSLDVRRLHDLGRSGWFVLLLGVPLVNVFVVFYGCFSPAAAKPAKTVSANRSQSASRSPLQPDGRLMRPGPDRIPAGPKHQGPNPRSPMRKKCW